MTHVYKTIQVTESISIVARDGVLIGIDNHGSLTDVSRLGVYELLFAQKIIDISGGSENGQKRYD